MTSSPTAPPPPTGAAHPLGASLRRSTSDRILLGLCGGVARSTGTSAIAVRLGTIALGVILLPLVVLAYLVTALILPRDDGTVLLGHGPRERRDSAVAVAVSVVAAPVVFGAGAGSLATSGDAVWPILAIAIIAALVAGVWRPDRPATTFASTATPPSPASDPEVDRTQTQATAVVAAGAPAWDPTATAIHSDAATTAPDAPATSHPGSEAPTFVKHGQGGGGGEGPPHGHGGGGDGPQGDPPPPPAPAGMRRRSVVLPVLAILALIPSATAVLVATGAIDSSWSDWAVTLALMAVASAAGAVAIALLRPSYLGAGLLVLVAAALGASSVAVNQFGPLLDDGIGERTFRPTTLEELGQTYTLGAGELTVDLRDLELRRGSRTLVDTKIGFGEVSVIVPRGVRVTVAPGSTLTGLTTSARRNGASPATSAAAPVIELRVRARGAEVRLLTGNARLPQNLETLAVESTGFWDGDAAADEPRPTPPRMPERP